MSIAQLLAQFAHQRFDSDFGLRALAILLVSETVNKGQCDNSCARLFQRYLRPFVRHSRRLHGEQACDDLQVVLYPVVHFTGKLGFGVERIGQLRRAAVDDFCHVVQIVA